MAIKLYLKNCSLNLNQSKSTDYQWKLTDSTVENIVFTNLIVKNKWFNSKKYSFHWWISENLTDSDLESAHYITHAVRNFCPDFPKHVSEILYSYIFVKLNKLKKPYLLFSKFILSKSELVRSWSLICFSEYVY